MTRADRHNNPTAMTTGMAHQAGLVEAQDYTQGDFFTAQMPGGQSQTLYTARLRGDPVGLTIRVIDTIGFRTKIGSGRCTYINMPSWLWQTFTRDTKVDLIGDMYAHEEGVTMRGLFPRYGLV